MLFCTSQFLVFFTVVFAVYWTLRWHWARIVTVAAAGAFLAVNWTAWTDTLPSRDSLSAGTLTSWLSGQYIPPGSDKPDAAPKAGDAKEKSETAALSGTGGWCWVAVILAAAVFAAYLHGFHRGRVLLLLGASFFFYASWNKWLALLICLTTLMDYLVALGMDRWSNWFTRRSLLVVSLVINLGLLCYLKYSDFFLRSLLEVLQVYKFSPGEHVLRVILPIGISFYTFEAINYTIDVYCKRTSAEKNLLNFMVFILFFPHLVAGPIVRARDFLPQLHRQKRWDWGRLQLGAQFFLMGLFKKLAIADRMALYADPVFADPASFNSSAVWLATIGYALQIYCDFSGYTDMALGSAHMLGYKLAQNFNMPYLAANVSEFWRRWHISLSSWLRDYLFIPLGGSRGTNWQTNRNLMITMSLGGLWHGANWTFIVWGVLHGLYLVIHRAFRGYCDRRPRLDWLLQTYPGRSLCMLLTFLCVLVGWVFFRAQTFGAAATILHKLAVPTALGQGAPLHNRSLWYTVAVVALSHWLAHTGLWKKTAVRLPSPVLGFGYATVLTLALVLAPESGKAFIYFDF